MKAFVLLLGFAAIALGDWKVHIDKKASQITGNRTVYAETGTKGLGTARMIIGCLDGQSVLRLADRFHHFYLVGVEGSYSSRVRLRPNASTEYIDTQVAGGFDSADRNVSFLILDNQLPNLLPRMRADTLLLVELPYPQGGSVAKFPMAGLEDALAKMAAAGCRP